MKALKKRLVEIAYKNKLGHLGSYFSSLQIIDDSKLRSLGWEPKAVFDQEIIAIVDYYKNNFIW